VSTTTEHTCKNVVADRMGRDPEWPLLAFGTYSTIRGPWSGDGGVQAYLLANGYQAGYPGNPAAIIDGLGIDADVAATVPCPACGATGGRFEAYADAEGGYGAAVAICPQCDHAGTF